MAAPQFQITADEINCLIYSYFKDSGLYSIHYMSFRSSNVIHIFFLGFNHSAFALCSEGSLKSSPWFSKHIPRGELIDLLSKALLYIEVESHWRGDSMTTNCKNKISLLEPHVCTDKPSSAVPFKLPTITPATRFAPSLRSASHPSSQDASSSRNSQIRRISSDSFYNTNPSQANGTLATGDTTSKRKGSPNPTDGPLEKRAKRELDDMDLDSSRQTNARQAGSAQISNVRAPGTTQSSRSSQENGIDASKRPRLRISQGPIDDTTNPQAIMMLSGHRKEVFVCSFNPSKHTLLATGYAQLTTSIKSPTSYISVDPKTL
jgi:transducin (beta)-like 1